MGKKQFKGTELEEIIYILCFNKSRYNDEISRYLYAEDWKNHKPTISNKISYLEKKNFLKQDKNPRYNDKDKRTKNRNYHISTVKPVIDRINEITKLTDIEKQQLSEIFEKDCFRANIDYENGYTTFSDIFKLIQTLSIGCQVANSFIENKIKEEHKHFSPEQWKSLIEKQKNVVLKFSQEFDNKVEESYEQNTPNTERGKITPSIFDKLIELRFEFTRLSDSTIEKLTKLIPPDKKTVDALLNVGSTISEYKQEK